MAKKLVLSAPNLRGRGLKNLAKQLTKKVGYYVYRVSPDRVRNRIAFNFRSGIDKREQLRSFVLHGVNCPTYATSIDGAAQLDSRRIVARRLVNASEGRGITICTKETLVPAPLYTEYIPKKKEFRVHVLQGKVIDVAEKRKRKGHPFERDTQVRNTANGYVFCRGDLVEPDNLRDLAVAAVRSLNRQYGAVDIVWNEKRNQCYVLEVNSRPGMEGTTVEKYADAIVSALPIRKGRKWNI
jgi:hypothetical protein